jgi:hypothetical protein
MKSQARVVVIGGGIGGCSALYHLTREDWSDVVLVERDELTSGTTWHSAAQCPNLAFNQLLIGLRSYTIDLYRELAEDPDYPVNYHYAIGGLRLITDQQQHGEPLGLTGFGMYALESMRLERGYGHWKSDLIDEYNPLEVGLARFVNLEKSFPGKKRLQAQLESGNRRERVLLMVECETAPCQPGEPVYQDNDVVGSITSAAWGFRMQKNLVMAYLEPAFAASGTQLEVSLLGQRYRAICL